MIAIQSSCFFFQHWRVSFQQCNPDLLYLLIQCLTISCMVAWFPNIKTSHQPQPFARSITFRSCIARSASLPRAAAHQQILRGTHAPGGRPHPHTAALNKGSPQQKRCFSLLLHIEMANLGKEEPILLWNVILFVRLMHGKEWERLNCF